MLHSIKHVKLNSPNNEQIKKLRVASHGRLSQNKNFNGQVIDDKEDKVTRSDGYVQTTTFIGYVHTA